MIDGTQARLVASVGRSELERLQASTVAVVGAGLLGGTVIHHLALLGVGMVVVDCGSSRSARPEATGR